MLQSRFFKVGSNVAKRFFTGIQNRPGLTIGAFYVGYESYHEYQKLLAAAEYKPPPQNKKITEPPPKDVRPTSASVLKRSPTSKI